MNNQYSRGCDYNYRRSAQRDMNMSRSVSYGSQAKKSEMNCSARRAMENRTGENCHMEEHSTENRHMTEHSMQKPLAMGYVPMQVWNEPLSICKALRIGTIFEELHKPFCGKGGVCR